MRSAEARWVRSGSCDRHGAYETAMGGFSIELGAKIACALDTCQYTAHGGYARQSLLNDFASYYNVTKLVSIKPALWLFFIHFTLGQKYTPIDDGHQRQNNL